ncbi:MAG: hypothetical protein ACLPM3_16110 [Terracidiphilus sp.]
MVVHDFVVMPNHVHVTLPSERVSLNGPGFEGKVIIVRMPTRNIEIIHAFDNYVTANRKEAKDKKRFQKYLDRFAEDI